MKELQKKLEVLTRICRRFNEEDFTYAIGSSLMLYFNDIVDDFHDIDILVVAKDAERMKEVLLEYGQMKPYKQNEGFASKYFYEFIIEDVEFDIIGNFVIKKDDRLYDFSLKEEDIDDYRLLDDVIIPLHALPIWECCYLLMDRGYRIRQIEEHRSDERWDAYDEKMNKLEGITLSRGDRSREHYHLVALIIVRHVDGDYLVMRRDLRKSFGGFYEFTSGGAILQGETPMDGAVRELYEETGIRGEMRHLDNEIDESNKTIYAIYECLCDIDKDDIVLQEKETIGYRWLDENGLRQMNRQQLVAWRTWKYVFQMIDYHIVMV